MVLIKKVQNTHATDGRCKLVYQEVSDSRSDASKREHSIKSLKKRQKEHLVDIYQRKRDNEALK